MPSCLVQSTPTAVPVHTIKADDFGAWVKGQDDRTQAWVESNGFKGTGGGALLLPGPDGHVERIVYVLNDEGIGGPWRGRGYKANCPKAARLL